MPPFPVSPFPVPPFRVPGADRCPRSRCPELSLVHPPLLQTAPTGLVVPERDQTRDPSLSWGTAGGSKRCSTRVGAAKALGALWVGRLPWPFR